MSSSWYAIIDVSWSKRRQIIASLAVYCEAHNGAMCR
jgi:hypothetical protein